MIQKIIAFAVLVITICAFAQPDWAFANEGEKEKTVIEIMPSAKIDSSLSDFEIANVLFRHSLLKTFTKEVPVSKKEMDFCHFVEFSSSDIQKFLNEYLIKKGIKKEELENYVVYSSSSGFRFSGWSWLGYSFFEKQYKTIQICYYDKREIIRHLP